jgi:hypothetical protein
MTLIWPSEAEERASLSAVLKARAVSSLQFMRSTGDRRDEYGTTEDTYTLAAAGTNVSSYSHLPER